MPRLNAPCEKNGVDCPKRVVGCRTDCPEWQRYEKAKAEQYQRNRERIAAAKLYSGYCYDGFTKTLRRKKAEGRK